MGLVDTIFSCIIVDGIMALLLLGVFAFFQPAHSEYIFINSLSVIALGQIVCAIIVHGIIARYFINSVIPIARSAFGRTGWVETRGDGVVGISLLISMWFLIPAWVCIRPGLLFLRFLITLVDNVVEILTTKVIDDDERWGMLYSYNSPDREMGMKVVVIDATKKEKHIIRVPPNMTTAKEAVAWTYQMPSKDYNPQKRT